MAACSRQPGRKTERGSNNLKGNISKLLDGYGFIQAVDGSRYFFHHTEVVQRDFNRLKHGELCCFDLAEEDSRGPRAINVITYEVLSEEELTNYHKNNLTEV